MLKLRMSFPFLKDADIKFISYYVFVTQKLYPPLYGCDVYFSHPTAIYTYYDLDTYEWTHIETSLISHIF